MSATEKFRKQHAEIVLMVGQIEPLLDPQKLTASANEVRSLLSTLLGKLSLHLAMEDNSLYPRLQQHQDPKLREIAKQYMKEMSDVKPSVEAFGRKWTEREIQANAATFCAETKKIFAVLADRIKRENTQFYPLIDGAVARV